MKFEKLSLQEQGKLVANGTYLSRVTQDTNESSDGVIRLGVTASAKSATKILVDSGEFTTTDAKTWFETTTKDIEDHEATELAADVEAKA